MATIILKFSLPEEKYEADLAVNAQTLCIGRDNFRRYLLNIDKFKDINEQEFKLFDEISDKFFECFQESFDKIE